MTKPDKKEFLRLVQQHGGLMQKVIRLCVDNSDDRQDMLQEILLQAWCSYPSFQGISPFSDCLCSPLVLILPVKLPAHGNQA